MIKRKNKHIQKLKKEIKEKTKKAFPWAITITLTIIVILLVTGLRIKFSLQDDVSINIHPAEKSFRVLNTQNQEVTFQTKVRSNRLCSVSCSYEFIDQSADSVLDTGNLTVPKEFTFNRTYLLPANQFGSGQKIYNFDVKCHNIQAILCSTENNTRTRTSFITLRYELSPTEEQLREELKEHVTKAFIDSNEAAALLQNVNTTLKADLISKESLQNKTNELTSLLPSITLQANKILSLWKTERYNEIKQDHSAFFNRTINFKKSTKKLDTHLEEVRGKQNNLTEKFNQLRVRILDSQNKSTTQFNNNVPEILQNLSQQTLSQAHSTVTSILSKKFKTIEDLQVNLVQLEHNVTQLEKAIHSAEKILVQRAINLSQTELDKKCALGYCNTSSKPTCEVIEDILTEFDTTYFTPINNVSVPDREYYNQTTQGVSISPDNKTRAHYELYCKQNNKTIFTITLAYLPKIIREDTNRTPLIENELSKNPPLCCTHAECSPCCTDEKCKNDKKLYPVILMHGHSLIRQTSPEPLLDNFNRILYKLQEDRYLNAGIIQYNLDTDNITINEWGFANAPIALKASYYYDYYYALGDYLYITNSAENIETYTIRLNSIIKEVLKKTGKPKVNIVAHSMGGLVIRRYLQIFGEDSVDNLVLIATPNHGVSGDVKRFCRIFGDKKECQDMYEDSIFLKKLNDPNNQPKSTKLHVIYGTGCDTNEEDGDGVTTITSAQLTGATTYLINGTCTDTFSKELHSKILDIELYPTVYNTIYEILQGSQ
ncbi:MAG: alpha/beta fold hydrolase [Nanoarchaeota archaeon]|nr:alpha/beta fold hydrolase [Nanoarchaeota archaeon]